MAKKSTVNNPDGAEREYVRDLRRYVREMAAEVERLLVPSLPAILEEYKREARSDAWTDRLREIMNELIRLMAVLADPRVQRLPGRFTVVSSFNDAQIAMIAKANTGLTLPSVQVGAPVSRLLGVNVFRNEPFLAPMAEGWVKVNTDLIKSLPTRLNSELEGIIARGVMNGASVKQLRDQIRARYPVSNYRATLIAQDQTLKLNAALTRSRLESLGVRQYTWRSVQDSRVRPEHADLNGKVFSFDNPPSEGNPGTPVRCRCRAEAVWPTE